MPSTTERNDFQRYSLEGRSIERPCVEILWSSMLFTQETRAVVHGALQRYSLKGVQLNAPTLWPNIIVERAFN
jgi:hypothetical protein